MNSPSHDLYPVISKKARTESIMKNKHELPYDIWRIIGPFVGTKLRQVCKEFAQFQYRITLYNLHHLHEIQD